MSSPATRRPRAAAVTRRGTRKVPSSRVPRGAGPPAHGRREVVAALGVVLGQGG
eukprot:CAMPEP_0175187042 /NCGR_PEP_ID=MMETSP0093-20121207/2703_1 /TAXON_ID=311494 /ORGANISM="Alexandrium monilatum, Strain CCMP3105" /LENGTH=53 /DNA_ID=CAMNT_0016479783 /DNA_START=242 /DNA_END=399 /DNA_ORIENTATION=+